LAFRHGQRHRCDSQFTVNQIAVADSDEGSFTLPVDFQAGDTVYMSIEINRTTTRSVDATLEGSTASFVIGSDIADQCRTQWSTFQIIKTRDGLETPLVVGSFERYDGR